MSLVFFYLSISYSSLLGLLIEFLLFIVINKHNKWFDGYDGEANILLDDYDCGTALGYLLKVRLDSYACSGEIKGGTVALQKHTLPTWAQGLLNL